MSSKSRSRSRSLSRSPRYNRRSNREDSMSPIRTASGASLRTPKNYNSANRNYNQYNNNNYGYRNYGYNNRGYYGNQRYNYGRWNRGRGNWRGQYNYRNQQRNDRRRYSSRSDRSRSRSRSRSYDSRDDSRSRSRSSSYDRSRSRSRSKDNKRRRTRSRSHRSQQRSKSKSPQKKPESPKADASEKTAPKPEEPKPAAITVPSTTELVAEPENIEEDQPKEGNSKHFAESSAFTRSRWETPDGSPSVAPRDANMDLSRDEIFDKWDDDKLREYLLKSKGQKVRKEVKQMMDSAEPEKVSKKKKKRSKSSADSPPKESPKMEKQSLKERSSSHDSSSSSSWSPIHKAPQKDPNPPQGGQEKYLPPDYDEDDNQSVDMQEDSPPAPDLGYKSTAMPKKEDDLKAVQYPFSHIKSQNPFPSSSVASAAPPLPSAYPAPVPPPAPPALPSLGEMQVLGPDGTAMRLVPTSIAGPDGKIIQVMQIQPIVTTAIAQPVQVSPAAPAQPPASVQPPKYPQGVPPPPTSSHAPQQRQTGAASYGYYTEPAAAVEETESMPQKPYSSDRMSKRADSPKRSSRSRNFDEHSDMTKPEVHPSPQKMSLDNDEFPFMTSDHVSKLKKMELSQKQSKKPEVLKTRFKPRPAGSWADEVKTEKKDKSIEDSKLSESKITDTPPAPSTHDSSNKSKTSGYEEQKIATIMTVRNTKSDINTQQTETFEYKKKDWDVANKVVEKPNLPDLSTQPFGPNKSGPQIPKISEDIFPAKETKKAKQEEKIKSSESKVERTFRRRDAESSDEEETNAAESKEDHKKGKSVSAEDSGEDEHVKRKKEKKKKKKNKKKKEDSDAHVSGKDKKKKKKQKEKSLEKSIIASLEHETIKSKKDLKAFEEMNRKSKKDGLVRGVDENLPISHLRGMVPRRDGEALQPIFHHLAGESLASSSSYEDRFVSLFSSSDPEPAETVEKIDLSKKAVRKLKISVDSPRSVPHSTRVSLSQRIKHMKEGTEVSADESSQKVSLATSNVRGRPKNSVSRSRSRSRSYSSSSSSEPPKKSKKKRKTRSRSSSKSSSRSRSVSLPAAYGGEEEKFGKRKRRSSARDDSDNGSVKRRSRDRYSRSRSRSRSSSGDERDRGRRRQMYYNRNNQGYYYNNNNNRGRGYYQNRNRGWYNNRGNYRGRWNWNNQGWNRNQYWRNQRYDRRDRYSRDRSRSRSRDRSDRSSSRERDDRRSRDKSPRPKSPAKHGNEGETKTQENVQKVSNADASTSEINKSGFDMFEEDMKPPGED